MLDTIADRGIDRSRPDFVQLRSESARLSTFHDWPSSAGSIVEPRQLAAVGLFYTGQGDRVQCAFCRGCLRSWKPGDRPAEEHRRHFPDCPFVRGGEPAADAAAPSPPSAKVKVKVHTLHSETPPQKRSGMARVLKGSQSVLPAHPHVHPQSE